MASLQLPVKYPQLPVLQIGQIQTLIWCIGAGRLYDPTQDMKPNRPHFMVPTAQGKQKT